MTKEQIEKFIINFCLGFIFTVILFFAVVGFMFLVLNNNSDSSRKYTYNLDTLNNTLDLINSNCGETHIVKKPFDDRYYVFVRNTRFDGYEKYEYVLLSDCLGGN